ncbi:hypothetical protein [Miniimonas sp. S16]|uniref:hypothetical protein n=1 Tax=Miniimonas sp. S16 TaxID=2171623 RepID=UPI000D526884|nr:hypothetical protein [Miniimonas sp. S16]
MIEEDVLDQDAVFCVGRVVSVDGRRVRVAVDKLKNGSHLLYRGGLVRNVAVASYVKIVKPDLGHSCQFAGAAWL